MFLFEKDFLGHLIHDFDLQSKYSIPTLYNEHIKIALIMISHIRNLQNTSKTVLVREMRSSKYRITTRGKFS